MDFLGLWLLLLFSLLMMVFVNDLQGFYVATLTQERFK